MEQFAKVVKSKEGLDVVTVGGPMGSYLECFLFGAHITKFITSSKIEPLFMSEKAIFDGKTPIRGGIPIIFPQFSNKGSLIKHGFARISNWEFSNHIITEEYTEIILTLSKRPEYSEQYPYEYKLEYSIKTFTHGIKCELKIHNLSSKDLPCHMLYHNYFRIPEIEHCEVQGFRNTTCYQNDHAENVNEVYHPKPGSDKIFPKCNDKLIISSETYHVVLTSTLPSRVIWNCGEEQSKALIDFNDDDYQHYLCVEPGFIENYDMIPSNSYKVYEQSILVDFYK